MGRITTPVSVRNAVDQTRELNFDALVDTGAAYLSLPTKWMKDLGEFNLVLEEELYNATGQIVEGKVAGPVEITIEGFRTIFSEVLFVDMEEDENGEFEPLLGYIPMEQANIAVDVAEHRLLPSKRMDLK